MKTCVICGAEIENNARKYCISCAAQKYDSSSTTKSNKVTSICKQCGKTMENVSPQKKYCAECSYKRKLARANAVSKARRKKGPKICLDCGTDISNMNPGTKYCRECALKRRAAATKKAYAKYLEQIREPKKKKTKIKQKVENINYCVGCKHREYMSGLNCYACCFFVNTGKERLIAPKECYKHKNTPYERVR